MFKRSVRYITLALTLVALTAAVRPAHAQSDDPCSDPGTGCIVPGSDPIPPPPPTGQAVIQNGSTLANSDGADSQSLDDQISYLMILYGLA